MNAEVDVWKHVLIMKNRKTAEHYNLLLSTSRQDSPLYISRLDSFTLTYKLPWSFLHSSFSNPLYLPSSSSSSTFHSIPHYLQTFLSVLSWSFRVAIPWLHYFLRLLFLPFVRGSLTHSKSLFYRLLRMKNESHQLDTQHPSLITAHTHAGVTGSKKNCGP